MVNRMSPVMPPWVSSEQPLFTGVPCERLSGAIVQGFMVRLAFRPRMEFVINCRHHPGRIRTHMKTCDEPLLIV